MGEGTSGLSGDAPGETARRLEAEITRLREELDGLVSELDRRRHEILDVKRQVKRHPLAATLTGVALVAAAGGLVWMVVSRKRRRERDVWPADLRDAPGLVRSIRQAGARLLDPPEPAAVEPTAPRRFLAAVAPADGRLAAAPRSGPGRLVAAVAAAAAARGIRSGVARAVRAALERWWSHPGDAAPAGPAPAISRWGRGEPRRSLRVVPPATGGIRP